VSDEGGTKKYGREEFMIKICSLLNLRVKKTFPC